MTYKYDDIDAAKRAAASGVKTYDCTSGGAQYCQGCYTMEVAEYGDWVRLEDYDALAARCADYRDRLLAALERAASAETRLAEATRIIGRLLAIDTDEADIEAADSFMSGADSASAEAYEDEELARMLKQEAKAHAETVSANEVTK